MENLPTYRLTQSGPEAQEILDQVNLNTVDIEQLKRLYQALTQSEPEIIAPTDTWPVANPEENVIYRVDPETFSGFLMHQIQLEEDERVPKLLEKLLYCVPVWSMSCTRDPEAARLSHGAMSGFAE